MFSVHRILHHAVTRVVPVTLTLTRSHRLCHTFTACIPPCFSNLTASLLFSAFALLPYSFPPIYTYIPSCSDTRRPLPFELRDSVERVHVQTSRNSSMYIQ